MTVPRCLVIIPDRNRTWAKSMGLPEMRGHTKGAENSRQIIRAAFDSGVQHVVFWAASELNLKKRRPIEICHLFRLLKLELRRRLQQREETGFRLIGAWPEYHPDPELSRLAAELESRTSSFTDRQLTILFGYSGLTELVEAFNSAIRSGTEVTRESLRRHFWTGFLPDLDLVIRTGVENDLHWSDWLLLLQMGNAVIYASALRWPEFSVGELNKAFEYYGKHPRKLGA